MKKIFKAFVIIFVLALCGLTLVACEFGASNNNDPSSETKEVIAKVSKDLQGTYYGDDVTVVIEESKVKITDPSGKTLEYTLYQDGDKIYILEEGVKVYCTFGDGTVTNAHGTFSKNGEVGPETGTIAKLPANFQGTFSNEYVVVVVSESSVRVTEGDKTLTYTIYVENNKYYIISEGRKIYCTFTADSVTNEFGTFTKDNNPGGTVISKDVETVLKMIGSYLNVSSIRLPNGAKEVESEIEQEDDTTIYAVGVLGATETLQDYQKYIESLALAAGFVAIPEVSGGFSKEADDMIISIAAMNNPDNGAIAVALVIVKEGSVVISGNVEEFLKKFKEYSGIELKLPEAVKSIIMPSYNKTDRAIIVDGMFVLDGVASAGEEEFYQTVAFIDQYLTKAELAKGEPITGSYEGTNTIDLRWVSKDGNTIVTLSLVYIKGGNYTFTIEYMKNITGGEDTPTWPQNEIDSFAGTAIPVYTGTFGSEYHAIDSDATTPRLVIMLSGVNQLEVDEYKKGFITAGFEANENAEFVKKIDDKIIAVYSKVEGDYLVIGIEVRNFVQEPWPADFIKRTLGEEVLRLIPELPLTANRTFSAELVDENMVHILVDGDIFDTLHADYAKLVLEKGFTPEDGVNRNFSYTLSNNDIVNLCIHYTSAGDHKYYNIEIELVKFEGLEYIIPDNFVAEILGFKLAKIGESYAYYYQPAGSNYAIVQWYLYDQDTNKWSFSYGNIYKLEIPGYDHVLWNNFGDNAETAYYVKPLSAAELNEFLYSTSGLAYMYYKEMTEHECTKDATKNLTLAGVACEYVTYSDSVAYGGTVYYTSKIELWVDPVSKMIYRVDSSLTQSGGSTTTNTIFEIKSMNTTVKSFAEAGFPNCIKYGFNEATATDTDHLYGEEVVVAATCGTDGETYKVCTICGHKHVVSTVSATGEHTPATDYYGTAVWMYDDNHHFHQCENCNQYYGEENHTFGEWVVERDATCKSTGYRYHDCTICHCRIGETIPVDSNKHYYIGYDSTNVTVVVPTKEAKGSITWSCREDCGATATIELPIISDANYSKGVYHDYYDEKNYVLYILDINKLIADAKKVLNTETSIDMYYIIGLFSYDDLLSDFDYDNPHYGFRGEEILDELAAVPSTVRGEYWNEDNSVKAVVGENTVTLVNPTGSTVYTLYKNSDGIYFNYGEQKVFVEIGDDGSIYAGNFGTFAKRQIAKISKDLQGEYADSDAGIKIELLESRVKVFASGKQFEYELYVNSDEEIYFINDEGSIIVCEFGENTVSNSYGTFTKVEGEEPGGEDQYANIPLAQQGAYVDSETGIKLQVYASSVVVSQDGESIKIQLFVDEDDNIYFIDGDNNHIICEFGENTITNAYGTFTKVEGEEPGDEPSTDDPLAVLDENLQGKYTNPEIPVVIEVFTSNLLMTYQGQGQKFTLYVDGEGNIYAFDAEGTKQIIVFGENTVTLGDATFTKVEGEEPGDEPSTDDPFADLDEDLQGRYTNSEINVELVFYRSSFIMLYESQGQQYELYVDSEENVYAIDEQGTKQIIVFGENTVTLGGATFTKEEIEENDDAVAELSEELQGTYVFTQDQIKVTIVLEASQLTASGMGNTAEYTLYVDSDDNIYFADGSTKQVIEFGDNCITISDITYNKAEGEGGEENDDSPADLDEDLQGRYYCEERDVLIILSASEMTGSASAGQYTFAYDLYVDSDDNVYVVDENGQKQIIEFGEDTITVYGGVYTRVTDGEEPDDDTPEELLDGFPFDAVTEALGTESYRYFTYVDAGYYTTTTMPDERMEGIIVYLVLPDDVLASTVANELIDLCEGYVVAEDHEEGYIDSETGYQLFIHAEGYHKVVLTYIKIPTVAENE